MGFGALPSVEDREEVFCRSSDRELQAEFRLLPDTTVEQSSVPLVSRFILTVARSPVPRLEVYLGDQNYPKAEYVWDLDGTLLRTGGRPVAELSQVRLAAQVLAETMYIGPFRNALNLQPQESYFDISVGQAFIQMWEQFKNGTNFKNREAAVQLVQEIGHIFGYRDLRMDASQDRQSLQLMVDGRRYKLSELGSGLTQFAVVLANVAMRRPSYILIDEPEANLHPSLQLDFLTTLGSYAREGVVFATHSIGLARASAEQVYSLRRTSNGESEVRLLEETPRLPEFLGELSFSGYRELGFDRILLVEGPTDVTTVQQFLRLYHKDHEVVLLHLGGGSLIHSSAGPQLAEITRITSDVFALVDSERDSPDAPVADRIEAFRQECEKLEIPCHVLERRAIENYFHDRAVKTALGPKYRQLQPHESRSSVDPIWGKAENWRIARAMTIDELQATDLGRFLTVACGLDCSAAPSGGSGKDGSTPADKA